MMLISLILPPHHAVYDAAVALDDFYDLGAHVLCVIADRDAVITVSSHGYGQFHGLQHFFGGDSGQDEPACVQCFRPLSNSEGVWILHIFFSYSHSLLKNKS